MRAPLLRVAVGRTTCAKPRRTTTLHHCALDHPTHCRGDHPLRHRTIGLAAHDAWLVPSLGSAILVQVMTPEEPSASLWSTLIGQLVAVPAGLVGVYVCGAEATPHFMSGHPLAPDRLLAVAVAVILTVAQRGLKATNHAGGAVALLLALGATPPNGHGALLLVVGIVLVTALGEPARVLILRLDKAQKKAGAEETSASR